MHLFGALMGLFAFSGAMATAPVQAAVPAPPPPPSYSVTLTGYNAVPAQTDGDPLVTASGAYSNPEVVAARSQDMWATLPFGTIIALRGPKNEERSCGYSVVAPHIGYRVIADTMNARFTKRVDVLFDTATDVRLAGGAVKNAGIVVGVCGNVTVTVVGFVDISNPANLPKTQAALAALVVGKSDLAIK